MPVDHASYERLLQYRIPEVEHTLTARDIVAKLSATVAKAAQTPDLKERYAGLGLEPISATPEQFAETIRRDIAKWRKVVAAAKIKPQ